MLSIQHKEKKRILQLYRDGKTSVEMFDERREEK